MALDWVLVQWADLANRDHLRDVQMTFQCGGLVLCGTLIGAREYFEGVGQRAVAGQREAPGGSPEIIEAFQRLYHSYAERTGTAGDALEPDHLHFRDVRMLFGHETASRSPALEVPFWRVRIAAVDGYLLAGSIAHLPVSTTASAGDEEPNADKDD